MMKKQRRPIHPIPFAPENRYRPLVYFTYDAESQLTKIGTTWMERLPIRLREHEHAVGHELEFLGTLWGDRTTESQIHRWLDASRDHGEWFRPSAELRAIVATLNTHWGPDAAAYWGEWVGLL